MNFNVLTSIVSFEDIAKLSLNLTNGFPEGEAQPGVVYMSTASMGVRRWEAGTADHAVADDIGGTWLGFGPDASAFEWRSATSDAQLHADRRDDGEWDLIYSGPEDRESYYAAWFALVANVDTLRVHMDARIEELKDLVREHAAGHEDADKLLRFIDAL